MYLLKFDLCRFRLVRRIGFDIRNCCDLFRCTRFATEKDFVVCISSLRSEYRIEVVVVVVVVGAVSLDSFDGRILVSSLLLLL